MKDFRNGWSTHGAKRAVGAGVARSGGEGEGMVGCNRRIRKSGCLGRRGKELFLISTALHFFTRTTDRFAISGMLSAGDELKNNADEEIGITEMATRGWANPIFGSFFHVFCLVTKRSFLGQFTKDPIVISNSWASKSYLLTYLQTLRLFRYSPILREVLERGKARRKERERNEDSQNWVLGEGAREPVLIFFQKQAPPRAPPRFGFLTHTMASVCNTGNASLNGDGEGRGTRDSVIDMKEEGNPIQCTIPHVFEVRDF